jgi:hypothetical protein
MFENIKELFRPKRYEYHHGFDGAMRRIDGDKNAIVADLGIYEIGDEKIQDRLYANCKEGEWTGNGDGKRIFTGKMCDIVRCDIHEQEEKSPICSTKLLFDKLVFTNFTPEEVVELSNLGEFDKSVMEEVGV